MSPRPYRLGQRQAATEQTRARILSATRELLMESSGFVRFSIEAVAHQADVARMTVYHQFGSKIGLLEALCDSLAAGGGMQEMQLAFRQEKALDALKQYLQLFSRFWNADRLVMRRLRALAALDPDFEQVIHTRDEWRRHGVGVLARRLIEQYALSAGKTLDETIDILFTLSSFETFDTLAGAARSMEEVAPLVYQLACMAFKIEE
ncbi:MAG TPA: TetR/AcrR family transcriptional regulator [Ktedonobacteraceae bacterium]